MHVLQGEEDWAQVDSSSLLHLVENPFRGRSEAKRKFKKNCAKVVSYFFLLIDKIQVGYKLNNCLPGDALLLIKETLMSWSIYSLRHNLEYSCNACLASGEDRVHSKWKQAISTGECSPSGDFPDC